MSIQSPQATVWEGCSYLDYIQDTSAISRSMMRLIRKSPRKYCAKYITKTAAPEKDKDELTLGSATHIAILEPERFDDVVLLVPASVLGSNGTRNTNAFREWSAANAGLCQLKQDDYDLLRWMRDSVWANARAKELLSLPGPTEHTVVWHDPGTGLKCKCRFDKFAEIRLDLKTAKSALPQDFAKAAVEYGYHNQVAHYKAGDWALTEQASEFVFIVVSKDREPELGFYQLTDDDIALGHRQNMEALEEISERMADNRWHSPYEHTITTIELPKWAHHQDDWRL